MDKIFFVDFDGTIAEKDVACAIVERFADDGWMEVEERWRRKEISTEECAVQIFEFVRAEEEDILSFVNTVEIDPYFVTFADLCRKSGYDVKIVSDGYDFYIKNILKKYGLNLEVFCNRMYYDNGWKFEFPLKNGCGMCGNCKRSVIKQYKKSKEEIIYIGDGYSDICPIEEADLVFAKGYLMEYCEKRGIIYFPFSNFKDIISKIFVDDI